MEGARARGPWTNKLNNDAQTRRGVLFEGCLHSSCSSYFERSLYALRRAPCAPLTRCAVASCVGSRRAIPLWGLCRAASPP